MKKNSIKDPHIFDFLNLRGKHDERELEEALVEDIRACSYLGRQQKLTVNEIPLDFIRAGE